MVRERFVRVSVAIVQSLLVTFAFCAATACDPCPACVHEHHQGQKTPTGQGLIAIDTSQNVGYAPIYTLSGGGGVAAPAVPGSLQLAAVDLTPGASTPVLKVIALNGAFFPLAAVFDSAHKRVLAAAAANDGTISVYDISTMTMDVTSVVPAPQGLVWDGFGGILLNPNTNTAYVAGTATLAALDASVEPPVFSPAPVTQLENCTDSLAINTVTNLIFISCDGSNVLVDASQNPLKVIPFQSGFGITDGVAFDVSTNFLLLSEEVGADDSFAFNFTSLVVPTSEASPASAPFVQINGLGEVAPEGEGPGGQTVANNFTHQGIIVDEFGQNLKLIQLPPAAFSGTPNNNGQPGSGTKPDAHSAYTFSATVIPKGDVNGTPTQLGSVGDPNSLTIDPSRNQVYMLADTITEFHTWQGGSSTPLFLIRMDMSKPVLGATPANAEGPQWTPNSVAIRMP